MWKEVKEIENIEYINIEYPELNLTIKKYIISSDYGYNCRIFDHGDFTVIPSPTLNCQIASIGEARIIIANKNAEKILKYIVSNFTGKNQILVDIHIDYLERLEKIVPEDMFTFKTKYTNTRYGTPMIMCLFKTEFLKSK